MRSFIFNEIFLNIFVKIFVNFNTKPIFHTVCIVGDDLVVISNIICKKF